MKLVKVKSKGGRKKVADPKIPVTFYTHTSNIQRMGGMEKTREYCEAAMISGGQRPKKSSSVKQD